MIDYDAADREFRPRILRYFSWTTGEDEREDLTQETMIRIQKSLPGLRDESSIAPWVFRIARNVLLDHGKRPNRAIALSRDIAAERFLLAQSSRESGPEAQAIREETRTCIAKLIDDMTETNRIVLLLSEFDELSAIEIASALGIGLHNAKIRIHRSRKAFREIVLGSCHISLDENSCAACQPRDVNMTPAGRNRP